MKTEPLILVAEDDNGHLYLLKRELKRIGIDWPIRRFADGQQAMDFFAHDFLQTPETPVPILLLDLRLPKVNGEQILAYLRSSENPRLRDLPVIIITSSCNPDDREQCRKIGCNDYLTKPFSSAELRSAILSALPGITVEQTW